MTCPECGGGYSRGCYKCGGSGVVSQYVALAHRDMQRKLQLFDARQRERQRERQEQIAADPHWYDDPNHWY
jgi:dihydrodipicolinate synthase/N-acetylneuraminate lyase